MPSSSEVSFALALYVMYGVFSMVNRNRLCQLLATVALICRDWFLAIPPFHITSASGLVAAGNLISNSQAPLGTIFTFASINIGLALTLLHSLPGNIFTVIELLLCEARDDVSTALTAIYALFGALPLLISDELSECSNMSLPGGNTLLWILLPAAYWRPCFPIMDHGTFVELAFYLSQVIRVSCSVFSSLTFSYFSQSKVIVALETEKANLEQVTKFQEERLQQAKKAHKELHEESSKEANQLTFEVKQLNRQINANNSRISDLRQALSGRDKEIDTLKEKVTKSNITIGNLKKDVQRELGIQNSPGQSPIDAIKSFIQDLQASSKSSGIEIKNLNKQLAEEKAKANNPLTIKAPELGDLHSMNDGKIKALNFGHQSEIGALIRKHESAIKQLESKHESATKQLNSKHESEKQELRSEVDTQKANAAKANKDRESFYEKGTAELEAKRAETENFFDQCKEEVKGFKNEIGQLKQQVQNSQCESAQLNQQLRASQSETAKLNQQLQRFQSETAQLKKHLAGETNRTNTAVANAITGARAANPNVFQANVQIQHANAQIQQLQRQLENERTNLKQQLADEQELKAVAETKEDEMRANFKKAVEDLEQQATYQELHKLERERALNEKKRADRMTEVAEAVESRLHEVELEKTSLEQQLNNAGANANSTLINKELEEQVKQLKEGGSILNKRYKKLIEEQKAKASWCEDMKKKFNEMYSNEETMKLDLQTEKRHTEEAKAELEKAIKNMSILQEHVNNINKRDGNKPATFSATEMDIPTLDLIAGDLYDTFHHSMANDVLYDHMARILSTVVEKWDSWVAVENYTAIDNCEKIAQSSFLKLAERFATEHRVYLSKMTMDRDPNAKDMKVLAIAEDIAERAEGLHDHSYVLSLTERLEEEPQMYRVGQRTLGHNPLLREKLWASERQQFALRIRDMFKEMGGFFERLRERIDKGFQWNSEYIDQAGFHNDEAVIIELYYWRRTAMFLCQICQASLYIISQPVSENPLCDEVVDFVGQYLRFVESLGADDETRDRVGNQLRNICLLRMKRLKEAFNSNPDRALMCDISVDVDPNIMNWELKVSVDIDMLDRYLDHSWDDTNDGDFDEDFQNVFEGGSEFVFEGDFSNIGEILSNAPMS